MALAPVVLAGVDPWLLQLAHGIVSRPGAPAVPELAARAILAASLMFAAPAAGLWLLMHLSRAGTTSPGGLRLRAIATLALSTPPLFTLVGVEAWLAGEAHLENVIWVTLWVLLAFIAMRDVDANDRPSRQRPAAPSLRVAHGVGALLLLAGFIGLHLGNHVAGLAGAQMHLDVMHALRRWYRSEFVEPALLTLCLLQLGTGAALACRRLAQAAGPAGTLQAATGSYLGLYLICHINSVFVYARAHGTDTDFWFAAGGHAGLLGDAWDVRLVPHYALAVLFLVVHLGAGLRVVLLTHGRRPRWLMPAAWSVGAVVSLGAVLPLLRIHAS